MITKTKEYKFKFDMNLDVESDCFEFVETYKTLRGRALANLLGFKGPLSTIAANALSAYAWNKYVAIGLRKRGEIAGAKLYEDICDRIYKNKIDKLIYSW